MRRKPDMADLDQQLRKAQEEKLLFDKRKEIHDVKKQMRRWNPPTTSKALIVFVLANCTGVEIYSMVAMWHFADLSALLYLIPAIVTEGFAYAVYSAKAYNENKQEAIIKLQRDQMEIDRSSPTEDETADPEYVKPDGNPGDKEPEDADPESAEDQEDSND